MNSHHVQTLTDQLQNIYFKNTKPANCTVQNSSPETFRFSNNAELFIHFSAENSICPRSWRAVSLISILQALISSPSSCLSHTGRENDKGSVIIQNWSLLSPRNSDFRRSLPWWCVEWSHARSNCWGRSEKSTTVRSSCLYRGQMFVHG